MDLGREIQRLLADVQEQSRRVRVVERWSAEAENPQAHAGRPHVSGEGVVRPLPLKASHTNKNKKITIFYFFVLVLLGSAQAAGGGAGGRGARETGGA